MSFIHKQGRDAAWERSVMRNLSTAVIVNGKIETTLWKAKELKKIVDKLVTLGKKNTVAARRQAAGYLRKVDAGNGKDAVQKLFDEVAPKYADRNGGYTRVLKLANRRGDDAPMAIIELV